MWVLCVSLSVGISCACPLDLSLSVCLCVCVCVRARSVAIPVSLCMYVLLFSARALGLLSVYFSSESLSTALWIWYLYLGMSMCVPECPYVCSSILWTSSCNRCLRARACPAKPSRGCVTHRPLHALPCVCGPRAFVRVCSPCAFEVCVRPGPCVCSLAPPCPGRGT